MASLHRVARREPPESPRHWHSYGVGYDAPPHAMPGFPRGYAPSHDHVAAIEVAIFHPSIGEIPYTLTSVRIPLNEALYTFIDDAGLQHREDYALSYNGRILSREETPHSLGIDPRVQWPAAVFEVVEFGSAKAMAQLKMMNRIGAALRIDRGGFETQFVHLTDVDSLSQVFSFLELDDLIAVTFTCALWHNVSQRLSLLLQLKCGAPPDVEYPAYLSLVADFSSRLDLGACRARAKEKQQWSVIGASKELYAGWESVRFRSEWSRPYTFVKAAGCTIMRTVQASCNADELRQMTLPLRGRQVNFMIPIPDEVVGRDDDRKKELLEQIENASLIYDDVVVQDNTKKRAIRSFFRRSHRRQTEQAPPLALGSTTSGANATGSNLLAKKEKSVHKVIKTADTALRQMSIKLFRSYFSPSMHYIFPLIAHQQKLNGLDFRSTQLWGITHGDKDGMVPVGAVAWRTREPLIPAHDERNSGTSSLAHSSISHTKRTLEVLFIAVWEKHRHTECGGALVEALEDEAGASGCQYMYVEVGREQPLARDFWGGLGFMPVKQVRVGSEQMLFFEHSCLRFADTEQFVKILT